MVLSNNGGRFICWGSKALCRKLYLAAGIVLICIAAVQCRAAERRGSEADSTKAIPFNVPAQPLESALESYSTISGWQVIYNGSLEAGRRSSDVKGSFTSDVALRMLLGGTGLIPQYKAADSVILVPDPMARLAPDEIADEVDPSFRGYYGLIQTALRRAFCASPQIRTGSYRVAFSFWIGSSGMVTRLAALSSTGRADIDESFSRAIASLSVGAAPPAGFAQPVVLLVTPDLVGKCRASDPNVLPIRAAQ